MTIINLRDRRQITLPPEIVSAAGLQVNDALEVNLINGVIQLVPVGKGRAPQRSMSRFLGSAAGMYGQSAQEVDAYVREQRDSW